MCRAIREKLRAACAANQKSPDRFSISKYLRKVPYIVVCLFYNLLTYDSQQGGGNLYPTWERLSSIYPCSLFFCKTDTFSPPTNIGCHYTAEKLLLSVEKVFSQSINQCIVGQIQFLVNTCVTMIYNCNIAESVVRA